MAQNSKQYDSNISKVIRLLSIVEMHDITDGVAREYGRLKAALVAKFAPREVRSKATKTLRNIGVSDNDLWIAAVVRHYDLVLLTQDGDFDRIGEVTDLEVDCWLSAPPTSASV